jgi:antitoxin ParD1/3/4
MCATGMVITPSRPFNAPSLQWPTIGSVYAKSCSARRSPSREMPNNHFGRALLAKIANSAKLGLAITWGAMPTRNVNLTEELDRFVLSKIESGRYENASEVVRAALRTLEREEQEHEAKLGALRAAIDEGDTSGVAGSGVFSRVRKTLKLPAARR